MDLRLLAVPLIVNLLFLGLFCSANLVLDVKHKFGGRKGGLEQLRAHDARRHGRFLSAAALQLPLGGNGLPSAAGFVYFFFFFLNFGCGYELLIEGF